MDLSTLTGFVIFGINFDTFLIVTTIIILVLLVLGIVLMVRNYRPITGFLLLILETIVLLPDFSYLFLQLHLLLVLLMMEWVLRGR